MAIANTVYLHGEIETSYFEKIQAVLKGQKITYCSLAQMHSIEIDNFSHLLVSGYYGEIREVLELALKYDKSVGIITLPNQKELMQTLELSSSLSERVSEALLPSEEKIDVLYANDTIVLQDVVIGDVPPLDQYDTRIKEKTLFSRIALFFRTLFKVKKLHHTKIKLTGIKENEIKFSAVGLVAVAYNNTTFASKLISKETHVNDGKLSLVIFAPRSIAQYIGYLFNSLVSIWTPSHLPKSVGYIRSSALKIESGRTLNVIIDSKIKQETPINLRTEKTVLALSVGQKFWNDKNEESNGKNSIKIDHIPKDEENAAYLSKAIPFFSHASQEQYTSLFSNLREESKLGQNFMVLLILSTMIATFGLFINSSSVVIGAMLLAPLMQPIVSLSMGVLRQDTSLEINGAKTITIGVLAVLATAAIIAYFIPIERLTTEMSGRLSPTILDLFVAIVSGAAAAYAKSNEKILGSLAGVAIAVALVPPLAVAGIGLGWENWHMFSMAFLLFITNLVGIVIAAALMFVFLGFSPLHVAKKGILIWFSIAALVAIPLYSSFEKMKEDIRILRTLSNIEFSLGANDIKLTHVEFFHRKKMNEVRCEVISTGIVSKEEKVHLKEAILKSIGKEVQVIVTFRYRL